MSENPKSPRTVTEAWNNNNVVADDQGRSPGIWTQQADGQFEHHRSDTQIPNPDNLTSKEGYQAIELNRDGLRKARLVKK